MYSGPAFCSRCGGALRFDAEYCPCGGRSAAYSQHQIRNAIADSRAVDDTWSSEAEELLQRELETRARPVHWTEAMAILRRRYVPR